MNVWRPLWGIVLLTQSVWAWNVSSTISDDFSDGNFTSSPTWSVVDQDASHPWTVSSGKLLMPVGVSSMKPTIRLDLGTVSNGSMVRIKLKLRNPYAPGDFQPVFFSLINSSSNTGYNLYGNPLVTAYGTSGCAWTNYNGSNYTAGIASEALGKYNPQNFETIELRFDPVNNVVEMLRDGHLALSFVNTLNLQSINRLEITNSKYIIPWEVDDVQVEICSPLNLSVNAAQQVSLSGGDDMNRMRSYFSSASWEFNQSQATADKLDVIDVDGSRAINIEDNSMNGNVFVPTTRMDQYLANLRNFNWKCHFVTAWRAPAHLPAAMSQWTSQDMTDYSTFANALIRHITTNSHPGVIVADEFVDNELASNPAWSVITQDASHPWSASGNKMVLPVGVSSVKPQIALDFTALPSTQKTYVTFDIRNPYPPGDYQPVSFSLIDSSTSIGYEIYGNPNVYAFGGNTGFAWTPHNQSSYTAGVAGEALGKYKPQDWEKICIVFDPINDRITFYREDKVACDFGISSLMTQVDRFVITNRKHVIPWEVRNIFIGDRPRDPVGDNFTDGNLTANPAWDIVSEDGSHPWAVSNKRLIVPSGSSTTPRIGVDIHPSVPGERINISFDVRNPYLPADYQPIEFSIKQKDINKGYRFLANPNSSVFGGTSGFARGNTGSSTIYAGVTGEALGKYTPQRWEHIVISFDPAANSVTFVRNGSVCVSFSNSQNLTMVDRFEIANLKQIVPWEIDNLYVWYGNDPLPEVLVEVENEADTHTSAWWINGTYGMGSTSMYNGYYNLYKYWADALELASTQTIRPLRIGGPAATCYTFHWGSFNWMSKLAADCATNNVRLDDLSIHMYGNGADILNFTNTDGAFPNLQGQISFLKNALETNGLDQARVSITEWGPSWVISPPSAPQGQINASNIGAAWTAGCLTDFLGNGLDKAVFLTMRDNYYQTYGNMNWIWCSYLSADGQYFKPAYNVFHMFKMMEGKRVNVTGAGGNIGTLAASSSNQVAVLAYNFNWQFVKLLDQSIPEAMTTTVTNLPFGGSSAVVEQYLIDRDHSNIYRLVEEGLPLNVNDSMLELVDSYNVSISGGSVTLPLTGMDRSAVSLWIIRQP